MQYDDAVEQLAAIHSQLAKGEVYRGYRPFAVAASGACGLLAPIVQPLFVNDGDIRRFVLYWVVVGIVAGCTGGGITLVNFLFREDEFARRRTRCVVGQFLPCLFVGTMVTVALLQASDGVLAYLPGLWVVLFSLGVLASKPYMPSETGLVAGFYLLIGAGLLAWPGGNLHLVAWILGVGFGVGQLTTAGLIYRYQKEQGDG